MANSTISLYNTPITPERNAWIDNINSFLSPNKVLTIPNAQYIKHDVNLKFKVAVPQSMLYQFNINYAKIQNSDDTFPFYYFIIAFQWQSTSTIELTLSLDSINTFLQNTNDGNIFTNKTSIVRQHLDRFYPNIKNNEYQRKVHKVSEGISPFLYKQSDITIYGTISDNFYLVYRTRKDLTPENIANPVDCFCLADKSMLISKGGGSNEPYSFKPEQATKGIYYYVNIEDSPNGGVIGKALTATDRIIRFYLNEENKFKAEFLTYSYDGVNYTYVRTTSIGLQTPISLFNIRNLYKYNGALTAYTDIINIAQSISIQSGTIENITTIPFKDLDRTDNRIVKIIKLPYAPTPFTYNFNGELIYDNAVWEFREGMLKLKDLSTSFYNMEGIGKFNTNVGSSLYVNLADVTELSPRNMNLESKLFHSDYYVNKLVYDTFSYTFKPENVASENYPKQLPISFKITNTINSKMLVTLENLSATRPLPYFYNRETDYEGTINISRNNEVVIFNNDYVNYIKSGYNYDKKSIKQQESYSWASTGIQIAGSVIGAIISTATGNPISAAASIAMGTSAVASFASNINSSISNERNMEAKLAQLAHQRSNVIGSDDIDLLDEYNGNRLHQITYKPSSEVNNALYNLFFYTGYSNPINGVPNTSSRVWFNFIQCKPVYTSSIINRIPKNYLDDMSARFASGVTRFHQHNNFYNIDQDKENLEIFLIN